MKITTTTTTTLPPPCVVVMKSGNLNFLEPSGPLQACNGTDLPLHLSLLLLPPLLLLTAIELPLGGSSAYTSTDKTNKNTYTYNKQYKNHNTNNTKQYIQVSMLSK